MSVNGITKQQVLTALGTVQEPELRKDLVSLNMICDVEIKGAVSPGLKPKSPSALSRRTGRKAGDGL